MTKEQRIEEMAVVGCVRNPRAYTVEECSKCGFKGGCCDTYRHAETLCKMGYGNVREFAEKVKALSVADMSVGKHYLCIPEKAIDELVKKYAVLEERDGTN